VEIVRAFSDAAIRGDWPRVAELVDPEVEIHGTVGGLEEGRVWHGVGGLVHQFEAEDAEAWEERRLDPQEFLPSGDQVVVLIHEHRRGRGSGVEVEDDTAVVATVRDGRIVRLAGYTDQDAARAAAGLAG
jgi:ketosteroid isomerase-like protein